MGEDSILGAFREADEEVGINFRECNLLGFVTDGKSMTTLLMSRTLVATLANRVAIKAGIMRR